MNVPPAGPVPCGCIVLSSTNYAVCCPRRICPIYKSKKKYVQTLASAFVLVRGGGKCPTGNMNVSRRLRGNSAKQVWARFSKGMTEKEHGDYCELTLLEVAIHSIWNSQPSCQRALILSTKRAIDHDPARCRIGAKRRSSCHNVC